MLLQNKETGALVEVLDVTALSDPTETAIPTQSQAGQEEQEPTATSKEQLIFPSGENLPRCWVDKNYQGQNA